MSQSSNNSQQSRFVQPETGKVYSSNTQPKNGQTLRPASGAIPNTGYSRYSAPDELPDDYVNTAEQVMRSLGRPDKWDNEKLSFLITTSKIRRILDLAMGIYNIENISTSDIVSEKTKARLLQMRIQIVYSAGREVAVKEFIERARLLEYLEQAGHNRGTLLKWIHYLEALVAYHRYLGGNA